MVRTLCAAVIMSITAGSASPAILAGETDPAAVEAAAETQAPTEKPTEAPTEKPTEAPTEKPTEKPTEAPQPAQTEAPAPEPATEAALPAETMPQETADAAASDKAEGSTDEGSDQNTDGEQPPSDTQESGKEEEKAEAASGSVSITREAENLLHLGDTVTDTAVFTLSKNVKTARLAVTYDSHVTPKSVSVSGVTGAKIKVRRSDGTTTVHEGGSADLSEISNISTVFVDLENVPDATAFEIKTSFECTSSTSAITTGANMKISNGTDSVTKDASVSSKMVNDFVGSPVVTGEAGLIAFDSSAKVKFGGMKIDASNNSVSNYQYTLTLPDFITTQTVTLPSLSSSMTMKFYKIVDGEAVYVGDYTGGEEIEIDAMIEGIKILIESPENAFDTAQMGTIKLKNNDKENKKNYFEFKADASVVLDGTETFAATDSDGMTFEIYKKTTEDPVVTPVYQPETGTAPETEAKAPDTSKETLESEAKATAEKLAAQRAILNDRFGVILGGATARAGLSSASIVGRRSSSSTSSSRSVSTSKKVSSAEQKKKVDALRLVEENEERIINDDLKELYSDKTLAPIATRVVDLNERIMTDDQKALYTLYRMAPISEKIIDVTNLIVDDAPEEDLQPDAIQTAKPVAIGTSTNSGSAVTATGLSFGRNR